MHIAASYTTSQLEAEYALFLQVLGTMFSDHIGPEAVARALAPGEDGEGARAGEFTVDVRALPGWSRVVRLHEFVHLQKGYHPDRVVDDWQMQQDLIDALLLDHTDAIAPSHNAETIYQDAAYHGILEHLNRMVFARYLLDRGEGLTYGQVAVLVGAKEGTVAQAAKRDAFHTDHSEGRPKVSGDRLLEWLMARGYRPTVYPEELQQDGSGNADDPERADEEEAVLVPVAADGTWFHPTYRRAKGYQLGRKGREQYVGDYWAALDILARHPGSAYWRRPNSIGNFGIVRAVRWEPVARALLERELTGRA